MLAQARCVASVALDLRVRIISACSGGARVRRAAGRAAVLLLISLATAPEHGATLVSPQQRVQATMGKRGPRYFAYVIDDDMTYGHIFMIAEVFIRCAALQFPLSYNGRNKNTVRKRGGRGGTIPS